MEYSQVKKLPKIELHCHLDGSIRPATLRKIAKQQGKSLPETEKELAMLLVAPENCKSLVDYLTRFDLVLELLQTKEALEVAAYDLIAQVAEENVCYIEVRFAPWLSTEQGLSIYEVVQAVLTGLQRGHDVYGVKSNVLLCGMRHHSLDKNKEIVQLANQLKNNGVVGIDLAGDEANYPPNLFKEMLDLGNKYHIPITLHAGECGCAQNIYNSIALGAKRIGHGIALIHDSELIKKCIRQQILLEMCPTSNLQTKAVSSIAEYPFEKLLHAGVPLCINTDNRTVSNTTLTKEYMKLFEWYSITYETLLCLNKNAASGAFLSIEEKKKLIEKLEKAYEPFL